LFVAAADVPATLEVAASLDMQAWHAGNVEAGSKQLLIEPLGLHYGGDALNLR
jgi:phosphoribosylformylglycinamidine cyclo-ligase